MPRLLVFDLDGTLIDSSLDLCNSVNAALIHVGKPPLTNALITTFVGDGAAMLVRRGLGDPEDLDSQSPTETSAIFQRAFDYFLTYYRDHKLDNTRCYPGVLQALTEIRRRHPHLPMAVLTNKPVLPSRAICDALALSPFFFQNYGGNSFPTKKPDPQGLQTLIAEANQLFLRPHPEHSEGPPYFTDARPANALRYAGASASGLIAAEKEGASASPPAILPAHTLMIGDSDVDVRTARAIGARSLGCLYGLSPHALQAAAPDRLIAHPSELPASIEEFLSQEEPPIKAAL